MILISLLLTSTLSFAKLVPRPAAMPAPVTPILVAIIDTGADTQHPLLRNHIWTNPGESGVDSQGRDKATNNRDDDGNGYIDDVHGWNFADNTNEVSDRHGHGTHIAGIIAKGADTASLMILKYFNPEASGETNQRNTLRAIEYATKMKVQIINYSAGGTDPSDDEENAIRKAAEKNILFIAAAGNEHSDCDRGGFFPATYSLPNILSVTAVDARSKILPSSNFGRSTIDLAASGKSIVSAVPPKRGGGLTGMMTGTSQATAFVTAAAAAVLNENRGLTSPLELIPYLVQTGDDAEDLVGKTKSGRAINVERALQMKGPQMSALGHHLLREHLAEADSIIDTDLPMRSVTTLVTQPALPPARQMQLP
jgi:thermitase